MIRFALVSLFVVLCAGSAVAESKTTKACEFSKRTLAKHPKCGNLAEEAKSIDCAGDATALNKINALQAKCKTQAEGMGNDMHAKLEEMKKGGTTGSKAQDMKQKLEAMKAERAAKKEHS